ncbi:MAG: hypothetical protein KDC98_09615 [Planctomycetes bacterium]|nr:hypothetical protein [Planctomycetota bacterium]
MDVHHEIRLDADSALVLFEFLSRLEDDDKQSIDDASEEFVLSRVHGFLQRALVEPLKPDYRELLEQARSRIRRQAGVE